VNVVVIVVVAAVAVVVIVTYTGRQEAAEAATSVPAYKQSEDVGRCRSKGNGKI